MVVDVEEVVAFARRKSRDITKNLTTEINAKLGQAAAFGRNIDSRIEMAVTTIIEDNYFQAGTAIAEVFKLAFEVQEDKHVALLETELDELKSAYQYWTKIPDNNSFGDLHDRQQAAIDRSQALDVSKSLVVAGYRNNLIRPQREQQMKVDLNANAGSVVVANLNSPGAIQTVHAATQTSIDMRRVVELADQAIKELEAIEIDHDLKNDVQDDLRSISHEARDDAPDENRIKRLMKKISGKLQDGVDNVYSKATEAGGAAIGAAAILGLSKVIFGS